MELDLEARPMGETLVLNRSLDHLYGDCIKLNHLNVLLELKRDQVDDLMPTIKEGKIIDEPMIDITKTRKNESFDVSGKYRCYRDQDIGDIILGEPFCKASCVEAIRFKHLSNTQCNKIKLLLKGDVYVCQPKGFIDADHPSHVYKLKKTLYGLKKAPRACTGLGEMMFFLGLQVNQFPRGIFINHSNYVLEILKKYEMETCDPIGTPMEIKAKLDLDKNGTLVDATKYQSLANQEAPQGDADYAGCKDSFKSTFGGIEFLGEKLVSWSLKKQESIAISCNLIQHSRTKHITVRYHFIKEYVKKGTIKLYFVKTDYQLADLFTKALLVDQFNYLVRQLGMSSLFPQELECLAKSQ
nr:hypothetical protein [Tanacetum cinerariifolium]